MDEIGFGPEREFRLPSRRWRVFIAVVAASAAAAGVALAVTTTAGRQASRPASSAGQSAASASAGRLSAAGCPPVQTAWPDLASLPVGMRPGALPVIIEAQFSGLCADG